MNCQCGIFFFLCVQEWGVKYLTFESDPEPIWTERDQKVRALCKEKGVECIERVSHTLWNPET